MDDKRSRKQETTIRKQHTEEKLETSGEKLHSRSQNRQPKRGKTRKTAATQRSMINDEGQGETAYEHDELERLPEKMIEEENKEQEKQNAASREGGEEAGQDPQGRNIQKQQSEEIGEKRGKRGREKKGEQIKKEQGKTKKEMDTIYEAKTHKNNSQKKQGEERR